MMNNEKSGGYSRRNFLKASAVATAGFMIVPRQVLGGTGFIAPSDRINLGYIGTGKQVYTLLRNIGKVQETMVVAACDVDRKKLAKFVGEATQLNATKSGHPVPAFGDYRELLARPDVDAVVVATPDHWHAMNVIDAAKSGKDIYCEKPLALTIDEGRAMVEAVKKYKRVLQTGSMQRSQYNFRQAADLVKNGYIGEIKEINVAVGEPVKQCDLPSMPIPDYLDWDRWIGPSLYRGYHPTLSPPIEDDKWAWWRGYRGFGGGYITDWGAHMFDIVQWALDMDASGPVSFVPPEQPGSVEGLYFTYANGVRVNHKAWGQHNAIQFVGTEGKIEVSRGALNTEPVGLAKQSPKASDKLVYHSDNHYQDWIDAIKKRSKPIADVEVGHRTASVCNAINIAYELQQPLGWNPKKELFDNAYANMLKGRPYRKGWDYQDF
ncbi:NADH-dependent dehydrogenase [Parapedobacter pyrenivorans]|uniref:NADH-dependent dehydrogenase n=1 Tax=Parapedobacter pyrenivorans TaxID=1305674 RepID=A0A917HPC6_9SPHI|nr:Gfo/Idh/MocA family oxidoreductase [Parapedobacter pyrenivorans]GGG86186.1 NADH-dependent dehydrogenase [Parapedobacter pyrenivorans]